MNEEIKKLIESVEILYCYGNEKDSFQTYENEACVRKSDFDKVVKELEYLSELRKPSEDIKQAIEEAAEKYQEDVYSDVYEESSLSEQKLECILDFKAGAEFALKLSENSGQLNESSSRSQDNGAELLEALKKLCDIGRHYIVFPDDGLDNAICEAMLTIYNYENQSK